MKKVTASFIFRLLVVVALATSGLWLYMHHNWLWLCLVVPLFFVSIYWFHRLYTYNTRKVAFLLDAIENDNPAVRFYEHSPDKDNSSVNMMLNRIARILYNVKQETAQREKYYELILDFVETGIVVLNSKGAVYQKNKKATQLLGMDVFTHTKQLSRISDELKKVMEEALPGDKSTSTGQYGARYNQSGATRVGHKYQRGRTTYYRSQRYQPRVGRTGD